MKGGEAGGTRYVGRAPSIASGKADRNRGGEMYGPPMPPQPARFEGKAEVSVTLKFEGPGTVSGL